jgi:hypothetical protein
MASLSGRYTARVMNVLGGISSFDRYNSLYQLSLEREVSTVSKDEAENGAAQSDQFRAASKQNPGEEKVVPYSTYVNRVLQFGQNVKKEAGKKDKAEDSCPIAKARSESQVGANVPLNWLVADQMGGQASTPQREDFATSKPEISFQDPAALYVSEPSLEMSSGGTLLSQEWLLSPCA